MQPHSVTQAQQAPAPVHSPQQTSPHQLMGPPALPSRGSVENRAKAIWDYTGNVSDGIYGPAVGVQAVHSGELMRRNRMTCGSEQEM